MLRNKNVFVEPLLKYNYKDKFFFVNLISWIINNKLN